MGNENEEDFSCASSDWSVFVAPSFVFIFPFPLIEHCPRMDLIFLLFVRLFSRRCTVQIIQKAKDWQVEEISESQKGGISSLDIQHSFFLGHIHCLGVVELVHHHLGGIAGFQVGVWSLGRANEGKLLPQQVTPLQLPETRQNSQYPLFEVA